MGTDCATIHRSISNSCLLVLLLLRSRSSSVLVHLVARPLSPLGRRRTLDSLTLLARRVACPATCIYGRIGRSRPSPMYRHTISAQSLDGHTMRVELIGHLKSCMTDIYRHICCAHCRVYPHFAYGFHDRMYSLRETPAWLPTAGVPSYKLYYE